MAVSSSSSSRTRSDYNPTLYRPRKYSSTITTTTTRKTTSFASSNPVLSRSPTTPRSASFSINLNSPISPHRPGVDSDDSDRRKKPCLCSPTSHPGSFRCALHKNTPRGSGEDGDRTTSYQRSINIVRLSAVRNSLLTIGELEGDFLKRAISSLKRQTEIFQRRREPFQPRPSRLSVMSRAADEVYS